ncbi:probable WRKY transcription factor 70 [Miscanthus floridulus]|uniref:probable WRKY transcription factor 70 n=1 Tax=Miscanthus floridulus TaxID=154761 RepID=UPI003459B1B7
MKREQSFEFGDPSAPQDAMGSASESSYSPPGAVFGLSPPESSPRSGRHNRRRDRPSCVRLTYTPYFDGHLWRKYGQKKIKDAEHPRLYFRCSYREDRQCLASKLLQQKNGDDPPLYEVTYTYEHTCGAPPVSFPDIVAEPPAAREGLVLRFDSPGGHGGDARMQQNGHCQQSTSRSPFMMLSFGSSSQTHDHQPAVFRSDLDAAGSPSFPTEGLPAPPPANGDGGGMFSTLNSFAYDFDNQMHFGDHTYLPHNNSNHDYDDY